MQDKVALQAWKSTIFKIICFRKKYKLQKYLQKKVSLIAYKVVYDYFL